MTSGAITLGNLSDNGIKMLEVRCELCNRHGRYRVGNLVVDHGREMGLPDLLARLTATCDKRQTISLYDQCQAAFVL